MKFVNFYRKYRPQQFCEVIGQEVVTSILQQQLRQTKTAHAYLFSGMQGIGKTSTARILAQAINCLTLTDRGEPCQTCRMCQSLLERRSDIYEIDAASHNGVEQIRALQADAQTMPTIGRKKIYIIDEVHMLSRSAFNAFLKILEEPPQHVVFILATTEVDKLPFTIVSRCQHFVFLALNPATLQQILVKVNQVERLKFTPTALNLIAQVSHGAVRDSLNLLEQLAGAFDTKTNIDQTLVRQFLGSFQTTELSSFLEHILERQVVQVQQSIQRWARQNGNFFKLAESLMQHCNQLQFQAQQNWNQFQINYPFFKHWNFSILGPLFQKMTTCGINNLINFQLPLQPRTVFEFMVLQLLAIQPLLTVNQQWAYFQLLRTNQTDLKQQVKLLWTELAAKPTPTRLEQLLSQTQPLAVKPHQLLLVGSDQTITNLKAIATEQLTIWLTQHKLVDYQVNFLTLAERDFLKTQTHWLTKQIGSNSN